MPRKVLIVEDDPDQVEVLTTTLELAGYAVASAESGAEGLARAREDAPDIIVLDVAMETAGAGFKVARELRKDPATKKTPIIMLTAVNRSELGMRFGADEDWNPVDVFLDKPVKGDELAGEIRKLLGE